MTHTHSWRICGSPIDPNLIGKQPDKHSITCARQTQAKSGPGEPSERPCPRKAGSRTEPSTPCAIGTDRKPRTFRDDLVDLRTIDSQRNHHAQ